MSRYYPPLLITGILLSAHLSFGILEGSSRTGTAILVAIAAELVMGRLTYGKWPHPASAYITGISVGILIRSPFLWAYALCSLVSIATKYVFRYKDRHLWNPSNFGVSALLLLAPASASVLSIQWGNVIWPMVVRPCFVWYEMSTFASARMPCSGVSKVTKPPPSWPVSPCQRVPS